MSEAQADEALDYQKRASELIKLSYDNTRLADAMNYSAADIEARLEQLEGTWKGFSDRDYFLQRFAAALQTRTYFKQKKYDSTFKEYIQAKAWATQRLKSLQPPIPISNQVLDASAGHQAGPVASIQASLEKLKLPRFDGQQREWEHFKEKFTMLIRNDAGMAPIIKLQHLTNCLEGEAANKLRGIQICGENYEMAWTTLCNRYDNKHLRFTLQTQALTKLPGATTESVGHLNSLLNCVNESINTFRSLGRPVDHWGDWFVYFVESKLAAATRLDWAKEVERKELSEFPKYAELRKFLEDRIRTLDVVAVDADQLSDASTSSSCTINSKAKPNQPKKNGVAWKSKHTSVHLAAEQLRKPHSKLKCTLCGEDHHLNNCAKFFECSQEQRRSHVHANKLCINCLSSGHFLSACSSQGRCMVCKGKHHTKLHRDGKTVAPEVAQPNNTAALTTAITPNETAACSNASSKREVLLSTAWVILTAPNGSSISVRALLDSGAASSFISEYVVQALSLNGRAANVAVSGIGGDPTTISRASVSVILKSSVCSEFSLQFSALILKRLTPLLPRKPVRMKDWPELEKVTLADPSFGNPGRIDCILNTEVYAAVLRPGLMKGPSERLVAMHSVFGWVLMGSTEADRHNTSEVSAFHITINNELSTAVARFWETEEVSESTPMSEEEQSCWNHFKETYSRDSRGRFIVGLPFMREPSGLDTYGAALACFKRLEVRFKRQPQLAESYKTFMKEYEDLGHMKVVPVAEEKVSLCCYLPHHPVLKKDGSGKIRVVFNASQKGFNGLSLNSLLHSGPKLQLDVIAILTEWAFFPHVFSCDIVKMFRQFLVHQEDRDWLRILWRYSDDEPLRCYRLLTVTYGTACAPFQANACLLQLADEVASRFPLIAQVLRRSRFVDDFFVGGDTLAEIIEIQQQLVNVLNSAGMEVGKWASNNSKFMAKLGEVDVKSTAIDDDEIVSTLGLSWSANLDKFQFKVTSSVVSEKITKRVILSEIAKLYDPIGWLTPIIIRGKILLQNLWMLGSDWDDAVNYEVSTAWLEFREQLLSLEQIYIPRWVGTHRNAVWQLHCFCDASERAYAAAIYVVVPSTEGYSSRLLTAKSKVAPMKVVSLPRLELCGAVLLAKLVAYLLPQWSRQPSEIRCWSDSKVVLAWLKGHPSRWQSFVANRVSDINCKLPGAIWNHVASADNPADLASRGVTTAQLKNSSIWWEGPDWLKKSQSEWPVSGTTCTTTDLEARKSRSTHIFLMTVDDALNTWISRFSSVDQIKRILAYVARWHFNSKLPVQDRRKAWLSALELAKGLHYLIRIVQRTSFGEEFQALSSNQPVNKASVMRRLSPFLDQEGLIRVGGRLQNSHLTEDEKHPIILPKSHHLCKLLIEHAHRVTLHGGPTLVQSFLLQRFWIIHGRNQIRNIIRKCIICVRQKAVPMAQQMAPLPAVRTRPARPFSSTGVDFAGPFWIRCAPGRGNKAYKGYICVFICLVVRAVHIEVVSDYTSAAFLAAFRRFTARRGLCHTIYSDNGTNFQGAEAELRRLFAEASALSQEVATTLAKDGVTWSFIPPRAPNFGGIWEASVRSIKHHLRRVLGDTRLTYEEFTTVTSSIEACLNSRPLSPMNVGESDLVALTPGHFLIGSSMLAPPEPFVDINEETTRVSRWKLLTLMRNHFWRRWQREVLAQMQQRCKWLHANRDFQVGDIVLFKDELSPPCKWPLARIIRLFKGNDGLCRVALIKTANTELKRPINKLILLPVREEPLDHHAELHALMAGGKEN